MAVRSSTYLGGIKWPPQGFPKGGIILSCGSSANTNLASKSVDCIVTDPPFFDNVHYSELADFFYAWQKRLPDELGVSRTTRHHGEVQDVVPARFAEKLQAVWSDSKRVLKDDGLLVFTYHHSRAEGWSALACATLGAGFSFVQAHPVKSEMAVAAPKSQAKEPIDLDVIFVCRKVETLRSAKYPLSESLVSAFEAAGRKVARFASRARELSRGDVLVVVMSQVLVKISAGRSMEDVLAALDQSNDRIVSVTERLHHRYSEDVSKTRHMRHPKIDKTQLAFRELNLGS
jgi:putative DNA methylase